MNIIHTRCRKEEKYFANIGKIYIWIIYKIVYLEIYVCINKHLTIIYFKYITLSCERKHIIYNFYFYYFILSACFVIIRISIHFEIICWFLCLKKYDKNKKIIIKCLVSFTPIIFYNSDAGITNNQAVNINYILYYIWYIEYNIYVLILITRI